MTEFEHGELVCNAGELFYIRIDSEGKQTFLPLREGQHAHYSARRTYPVLQAAQESLFSISKIPDGTLFTMKKGYLVKHGSYMLGVLPRTSEDSEPEKFGTEALNSEAILDILYPQMTGDDASKLITEQLVYLKYSSCWGRLVNGGIEVQELNPEGRTFNTSAKASEPFTKAITGAPQDAYKKLRRLPVGTHLVTTEGVWQHDEQGFIDVNGRRVPPSIQGGWISKIQGVNMVPAEPNLPSFSPKAPDELLWSKRLKDWVVRNPFEGVTTLSDGAGVGTPKGKLKLFSKLAQRAKGQKDLRKLEKLPAGTVITDSDGDTWVKHDHRPFSHDNWLTFEQTTRLQFHEHFIEVPRSALGLA